MWVSCLLILMGSCVKNDIYQGEGPAVGPQEPTEEEDYVSQFENFEGIQVNITSQYEGAVYSIYYEYPYEEGSLVKDPYLIAKTPIQTTLEVPKHVKKLYILAGNGELIETDVKDITINANTKSNLRAANQLNDKVLHLINNKYFPETKFNVKREDLYKCSDLKIAETPSTGIFENAEIWLTYISDGGMASKSGRLWFYTYPSEKMKSLTKADCQFYGMKDGKVQPITFNDISDKDGNYYIFHSNVEQHKADQGTHTRISLGEHAKGLNVGFVYRGLDRPQFSTPALNGPDKDNAYIGHKIRYEDNSVFEIKQNVANGFVHHIKEGDFEGNVLGMENRCPNSKHYDGDYNDMLCLIESSPVTLGPIEPIDPPVIEPQTNKKGFLLFEDNYPSQGDFDFNDAVVFYRIAIYPERKEAHIFAQLLAKGCTFNNEIGFSSEGTLTSYFRANGYYNVRKYDGTPDAGTEKTFIYTNQQIMPYINNGRGPISKNVKNTDLYPYVLDIPYVDGQPFRWCLENKSIDEAYNFDQEYRKKHADWYVTPKDELLVIQFPTPEEE